jgi:hypothetical protein
MLGEHSQVIRRAVTICDIELTGEINTAMPEDVVNRAQKILNTG